PVRVTRWHVYHDDKKDFDIEEEEQEQTRKSSTRPEQELIPNHDGMENEAVEREEIENLSVVPNMQENKREELEEVKNISAVHDGHGQQGSKEQAASKGMSAPDKEKGNKGKGEDVPPHPERRTRSQGPVGEWSRMIGQIWDRAADALIGESTQNEENQENGGE